MNELRFAEEIFNSSKELSKASAKGIKPQIGTTASSIWFYGKAGQLKVKKIAEEADSQIETNNSRYLKKVADEHNAPIIAKRDIDIKAVKEAIIHNNNEKIDARIRQNNETRKIPIRESSMPLIQEIKMLIDLEADISPDDWKAWGEVFAGHYSEEVAFEALAKRKGVFIVRYTDITKGNERLEQFRNEANYAAEHIDDENNLRVQSFFSDNPNSSISKLIEEIDSDKSSIIRAENANLLSQLRAAKKHAYDCGDIRLQAQIGLFIDRHLDELSEQIEPRESVYKEAKELISKGMNAQRDGKNE